MAASRKYTDSQRAEALALYETHGPTEVQKQLGISKATVTGWAKATGTRTVRNERTAHAVEAVKVDNKLRRQNIVSRMYGQAEKILDKLEGEEFKTMTRGELGVDEVSVLDFIPPNDHKTLVSAAGAAVKVSMDMEKIDTDNGTERAESMLDRLSADMKEAALNALRDARGVED